MDKPIFFRRCHLCGAINQSAVERVQLCQPCGHILTPFFYFDERELPVMHEAQVRQKTSYDNQYAPIHGLTAYWDDM